MIKKETLEKYEKILKLKKEENISYADGCRRMGTKYGSFSIWLRRNHSKRSDYKKTNEDFKRFQINLLHEKLEQIKGL